MNGYNKGAFGYDKEGPSRAEIERWTSGSAAKGGTGICCNQVAAVDIDILSSSDLSEKIKDISQTVFGKTPFIRMGQSPKILLVYRRDHTVKRFAQKCATGNGDGIEIIADWHFVAYGIHPKTLQYYTWIGSDDPLTAPPEAAPIISQVEVNEFLRRVQEFMSLNKTGGRAGAKDSKLEQQLTRDANGHVVSGRDLHLYYIVMRTWRAMSQAGEDITVQTLAERAWCEFEATTNLVGCKETYRDAQAKAAWRVRQEETRRSECIVATGIPTYQDYRISIEEAEQAIRRVIADFDAKAAARREAVEATMEAERQRLKEITAEQDAGIPF